MIDPNDLHSRTHDRTMLALALFALAALAAVAGVGLAFVA